jgi:hypothetical protein
VALKGVVTDWEFDKLRSLAAEGPFMVCFCDGMYQELKRLDAMGLVRPQQGYDIVDIRNDYGKKGDQYFDLRHYISITDEGREYLKLRDEVMYASDSEEE